MQKQTWWTEGGELARDRRELGSRAEGMVHLGCGISPVRLRPPWHLEVSNSPVGRQSPNAAGCGPAEQCELNLEGGGESLWNSKQGSDVMKSTFYKHQSKGSMTLWTRVGWLEVRRGRACLRV